MIIDGVDYRIADTKDDIEGAMHLVYNNYRNMDYCDQNRYEMYLYLFDLLPDTRTLVAVKDKVVIGTLTLVFDSELGVPSDHLYRAELEKLRISNRRIAEISKLAFDRSLPASRIQSVIHLFRLSWILASNVRQSTDICVLTEPGHEAFYAKRLQMDRIGAFRSDESAGGAPSILLRLNLETLKDRLKSAYGDKPGHKNLYHFAFVDPNAQQIEDEIRASDKRLTQLNRRLEERQFPYETSSSISTSMSAFLDFRLYIIKLVIERIMERARSSGDIGQFRDQMELYENLVNAIPLHYRQDILTGIYKDMGIAAWYCGKFEKAIEFAKKMRELSDDPNPMAYSHLIEGFSLFNLSRRAEADRSLRIGLAIPDVDQDTRASLLNVQCRLLVENLQFDQAQAVMNEAKTIVESMSESDRSKQLRHVIGHGSFVLATRLGDFDYASAMLDWGETTIPSSNRQLKLMFDVSRAKVSNHRARPVEALNHCQSALKNIFLDSNPLNASVLFEHTAIAHLSAGEINQAIAAARRSLTYAQTSRVENALSAAVSTLVNALIASDAVNDADDALRDVAATLEKSASPRSMASIENAKAIIASARDLLPEAIRSYEIVETLIESEPAFVSKIRMLIALTKMAKGDRAAASAIFQNLPPDNAYPGWTEYIVRHRCFRALFKAFDGDETGATRDVSDALALFSAGGAPGNAAETIWIMLSAIGRHPENEIPDSFFRALYNRLSEILVSVPIPFYVRKLKEASSSNA